MEFDVDSKKISEKNYENYDNYENAGEINEEE